MSPARCVLLDLDGTLVDSQAPEMFEWQIDVCTENLIRVEIYDARAVDLYQWICARYLVGVKGLP
jgi:beta-phosphoglucomutase-like phosphatase (HAD superfamily)